MSVAQNKGWDDGEVGSGKLTKSTVIWPIIPFSYKTSPIDFESVTKFIFGRDYWG